MDDNEGIVRDVVCSTQGDVHPSIHEPPGSVLETEGQKRKRDGHRMENGNKRLMVFEQELFMNDENECRNGQVVEEVEEEEFVIPPGSPVPPKGRRTWSAPNEEVQNVLRPSRKVSIGASCEAIEENKSMGKRRLGKGELEGEQQDDDDMEESKGDENDENNKTREGKNDENNDDDDDDRATRTLTQDTIDVYNDEEENETYEADENKPLQQHGIENENILTRLQRLEAENERLRAENELLRRKKARLSPAVYIVDAPKTVSKMRLGRTASIATKNELIRLSQSTTSPIAKSVEEVGFLERMNHLIRTGSIFRESNYLGSDLFADQLMDLCKHANAVFEKESRLLELQAPVYVFGDFHGNFTDLQFFAEHFWPMGMRLSAGKFLFLGDYVDRGDLGLELIGYLLAQKVQNPDKIFMIRGNHETRTVNGWEGFYGPGSFIAQCKARFGEIKGYEVWETINQTFDRLPMACILDKSIFCVHGGIPALDEGTTADNRLDEIRNIPCPIDIRNPDPSDANEDPANRLAFSLLWADPADPNEELKLQQSESGFQESSRGGGTVVFGAKAVNQFLTRFNFDYIMRAHEATASGVAVCKSAKVLTVFSTSKDHGCGGEAKCGCVLVGDSKIQAITRSGTYSGGFISAPAFPPGFGMPNPHFPQPPSPPPQFN